MPVYKLTTAELRRLAPSSPTLAQALDRAKGLYKVKGAKESICTPIIREFDSTVNNSPPYLGKRKAHSPSIYDNTAYQQRQAQLAEQEELKARNRATRIGAGCAEVVCNRIIVVEDAETGDCFFYHITEIPGEHQGFPDVVEFQNSDERARVLLGFFVGDQYIWEEYKYEVKEVCTVAEWISRGNPDRHQRSEYFTTDSGNKGNPTYRRRT